MGEEHIVSPHQLAVNIIKWKKLTELVFRNQLLTVGLSLTSWVPWAIQLSESVLLQGADSCLAESRREDK